MSQDKQQINLYNKSIELNENRLLYRAHDKNGNEIQYVCILKNGNVTSKSQGDNEPITVELIEKLNKLKNNFPI